MNQFIKGKDEGQQIAWWSWREIKSLPLHESLKFLLQKGESFFEKNKLGNDLPTASELGLE